MSRNKRKHKIRNIISSTLLLVLIAVCSFIYVKTTQTEGQSQAIMVGEYDLSQIPDYSGMDVVVVNNNQPWFTEDEMVTTCYETYGELDPLGRCTSCMACLSYETMPPIGAERGEIGSVKPSGWHTIKYDCVNGKYLYNRCHLIGWQLSNENANKNNLITGTRQLNMDMLNLYENQVAEYIEATGNHVIYRVTPYFKDNEMVCRGLLMEGKSVEDDKICFCAFLYNVQDSIEIDYETGFSWQAK